MKVLDEEEQYIKSDKEECQYWSTSFNTNPQ